MDCMLAIVVIMAVVMATLFAAGFLFAVFLAIALSQHRVVPSLISIGAAGLAILLISYVPVRLPPSIKYVTVPILISAAVTAAVLRRQDWAVLFTTASKRTAPTYVVIGALVVGGVVAYCLSLTSVGKAVLNALGQDVVGVLPAEIIEIRRAGAVVGLFIGTFGSLLLWSVVQNVRTLLN